MAPLQASLYPMRSAVEGPSHLRVAFIAGTLGQAGAEKQLVYMAEALHRAGVPVRVYCLTRGEYYEPVLDSMGIKPMWVGKFDNPLLRLLAIARALSHFRPHIVQSAHFYTNLYASLVAPIYRAVAIGGVRSDITLELEDSGLWGRWLLRLPPTLLANSWGAQRNARRLGIDEDAVEVLPNVIDLRAFDSRATSVRSKQDERHSPVVVAVGRLIPERRFERFLAAVALARQEISSLQGIIVGDGPERAHLEMTAGELGLLPGGVQFLGHRQDIPELLSRADVMLLTSDHEGFPNVLLEAMASSLPIIVTPAGDAPAVVEHGITGYVVPFDDTKGMAGRIVHLVRHPEVARQLGEAGRRRAEQYYDIEGLADRLLAIYGRAARKQHNPRLTRVLA